MQICDIFVKLWIIVIPISSLVLNQQIPGLTIANILAIFSIFIPGILKNKQYFILLGSVVLIFFIYEIIGQIFIIENDLEINNFGMRLISPDTNLEILRSSLFTQSAYLLCGFLTFLFFYFYYSKNIDKTILYSSIIMCLYGIYEFLYFLIYKESGDFLSNRIFGGVDYINGSFFQTIDIGIYSINKMKSLTGEPSMFAFTMFPYLIFSSYKKELLITLMLITCIFMSLCSTMILGFMIIIIYNRYINKILKKPINLIIFISLLILLSIIILKTDLLSKLIFDKFTTENESTGERFDLLVANFEFFSNVSFLNKIFGVGFGFSRSTDLFTTLLVNVGILGVLLFSAIYLYPVIMLDKSKFNNCLKLILIVNFFLMMISVSEFAYLPSWMFLGIAYKGLSIARGAT